MLAAMLIAQHQNANNKPLYGAYVMGIHWCFAILDQKNYYVCKTLDMTDPPTLRRIVFILRQIKPIILEGLI